MGASPAPTLAYAPLPLRGSMLADLVEKRGGIPVRVLRPEGQLFSGEAFVVPRAEADDLPRKLQEAAAAA